MWRNDLKKMERAKADQITENLTFIDGRFSPAEAADILFSIINDKIKFHTVKSLNLSHGEQGSNKNSEERIRRLKDAKKIIEKSVLKAYRDGFELEVNSTIEIKLVNKHIAE
mgnify:FL=1